MSKDNTKELKTIPIYAKGMFKRIVQEFERSHNNRPITKPQLITIVPYDTELCNEMMNGVREHTSVYPFKYGVTYYPPGLDLNHGTVCCHFKTCHITAYPKK